MENTQSLKEVLCHLEARLLSPQVRISPEEIELLLSKDFFEFGSSGKVIHREDCVGESGLSVREMSLNDFEISLLSENVVLATYRVIDCTRKLETLRSSIWKRESGQWRMFFHQGTIAAVLTEQQEMETGE
ncbi:DUF4440 domain-containing protein [Mesobacillus zeae]|uniref:DUF4440 domain-containing protein n=1 Tax=Mesobacillus zeae TaxID=1917180 RepID=A0A398BD18_9BACI|nr:DUF4440 domain-containing protein [Mesobacillus zeae]RID87504.1 DUF4440 domain-containing protein [Mesobacillus zeae]